MSNWNYATVKIERGHGVSEIRLAEDGPVLMLRSSGEVEATLQDLRATGWELVSMQSVASSDRYVLKRRTRGRRDRTRRS
jgi:hypothetical protein